MTVAGTHAGLGRAGPPRDLRLTLPATPEGVRAALADLRAFLRAAELSKDASGTAEIVLAEALNNVAEHAYGLSGQGAIQLDVSLARRALCADITDGGKPLPGLGLPAGLPPALDRRHALPEGGFGWFLIHSLTSALHYRRADGRNHLHIEIKWPE